MVEVDKKRKNNISEYLISIYQAEEQIRKCNFNPDQLKSWINKQIDHPQESKEELFQWYLSLSDQMKSEGLEKSGHLACVNEIIKELSEINKQLLKSDQVFRKVYDQAKLHILRFVNRNQMNYHDEVHVCLEGILQYMNLKVKNKPIDDSFKIEVYAFKDLLQYITNKYHQRKSISSAA